jgi:hypothetical protein
MGHFLHAKTGQYWMQINTEELYRVDGGRWWFKRTYFCFKAQSSDLNKRIADSLLTLGDPYLTLVSGGVSSM